MQNAYLDVYQHIQQDVGHYFRSVYNIVKFVHYSPVDDKHFYTNIVRAQLSNNELIVLFYNCITPLGRDKFKPLVEEYALLKHLPGNLLIDETHLKWYEPAAFGRLITDA